MTQPSTLSRADAQGGAPGWRLLVGRLHLSVSTGGFPAAMEFVTQVGRLAQEQDHHPDIDIRYSRVHLTLSSHDAGGITDRDLRLATSISELVGRAGWVPEHSRLTTTEIAIDTVDASAIRPFWSAVLGYGPDPQDPDGIADPDGRGPTLWFQPMTQPRPVRNRIHLDVVVAHDEAPTRLQAALSAGGRLVSDARAPAFWIVADADGNEACLCTWQARD